MGGPIKPEHLAGLDQLLLNEFAEKFISANKLWERRFEKEASEKKTTNIFCLGNQLYFNDRADLPGKNIKVARSIFENTNLEPYKEKLSDFDAVLTGSSWNKQLLEDLTQKEISKKEKNEDKYMNMNIATHENYTIDKIANIALKVCDAEHLEIKYNPDRPNGQMRKDIDTSIFEKNFPNIKLIQLSEGIREIYEKLKR